MVDVSPSSPRPSPAQLPHRIPLTSMLLFDSRQNKNKTPFFPSHSLEQSTEQRAHREEDPTCRYSCCILSLKVKHSLQRCGGSRDLAQAAFSTHRQPQRLLPSGDRRLLASMQCASFWRETPASAAQKPSPEPKPFLDQPRLRISKRRADAAGTPGRLTGTPHARGSDNSLLHVINVLHQARC